LEEIKHLAELSRLELSDREAEKLTLDAEEIVGFFDKLKGAEVSDEINAEKGENESETIKDEERESMGTGEEKEQFIQRDRNFLKIPRVFDKKD